MKDKIEVHREKEEIKKDLKRCRAEFFMKKNNNEQNEQTLEVRKAKCVIL